MKQMLVAAALSALCSFAAAATAHAGISSFSLTLEDLDTSDGITPSYAIPVWGIGAQWSGQAESPSLPEELQWHGDYSVGGMLWPASHLSEASSASLSGVSASIQQTTHSASVALAAHAPGAFSTGQLVGGAPWESGSRIQLTPNTRATLSFDIAVAATARDVCNPATGTCEQAYAAANVSFSGFVEGAPGLYPDGLLLESHDSSWSASVLASGNGKGLLSQSDMGSFSWEITNSTPALAYLSMFYGVEGDAISAAVPEPETYALMLLGLVGLGWRVARRRRELRCPRGWGW